MNKFIERIKSWLKPSCEKPNESDHYIWEARRKADSLRFWTPELIEWIGSESDPIKLASASCLVNCRRWPHWLPSEPESHDKEIESDELFFRVEVYKMLEMKSEIIAPKLHSYIWLTKYYNTYTL